MVSELQQLGRGIIENYRLSLAELDHRSLLRPDAGGWPTDMLHAPVPFQYAAANAGGRYMQHSHTRNGACFNVFFLGHTASII